MRFKLDRTGWRSVSTTDWCDWVHTHAQIAARHYGIKSCTQSHQSEHKAAPAAEADANTDANMDADDSKEAPADEGGEAKPPKAAKAAPKGRGKRKSTRTYHAEPRIRRAVSRT